MATTGSRLSQPGSAPHRGERWWPSLTPALAPRKASRPQLATTLSRSVVGAPPGLAPPGWLQVLALMTVMTSIS
jgi:hypothetical protein